jgi:hypothetical protein
VHCGSSLPSWRPILDFGSPCCQSWERQQTGTSLP